MPKAAPWRRVFSPLFSLSLVLCLLADASAVGAYPSLAARDTRAGGCAASIDLTDQALCPMDAAARFLSLLRPARTLGVLSLLAGSAVAFGQSTFAPRGALFSTLDALVIFTFFGGLATGVAGICFALFGSAADFFASSRLNRSLRTAAFLGIFSGAFSIMVSWTATYSIMNGALKTPSLWSAAAGIAAFVVGFAGLYHMRERRQSPAGMLDAAEHLHPMPFPIYSWHSVSPIIQWVSVLLSLSPEAKEAAVLNHVLEGLHRTTWGHTAEQRLSLASVLRVIRQVAQNRRRDELFRSGKMEGFNQSDILNYLHATTLLHELLRNDLMTHEYGPHASEQKLRQRDAVISISEWTVTLLWNLRQASKLPSLDAEVFLIDRELVVQLLDPLIALTSEVLEQVSGKPGFPLVFKKIDPMPEGGFQAVYGLPEKPANPIKRLFSRWFLLRRAG